MTERGAEINAIPVTPDTGPVFVENWFGSDALSELASLAASVASLPGIYIEVGSWEGRTSIAIANAIRPQNLHAVDTWQGNVNEDAYMLENGNGGRHPTVYEIQHHGRDVYARFLSNVAVGTSGNVIAHRMGWREFFASFQGHIKFLFIDADHTYDECKGNIESALPFLVPGAIVCGDDYGVPGVGQAVRECCPGHRVSHLWYWKKP